MYANGNKIFADGRIIMIFQPAGFYPVFISEKRTHKFKTARYAIYEISAELTDQIK